MKKILLSVVVVSIVFIFVGSVSADLEGSYGFNWLKPESSKCQKITEARLEKFKTCRKSTETDGFGGENRPTHICQDAEGGEWIIYATNAQCQDEFEIMKANE